MAATVNDDPKANHNANEVKDDDSFDPICYCDAATDNDDPKANHNSTKVKDDKQVYWCLASMVSKVIICEACVDIK